MAERGARLYAEGTKVPVGQSRAELERVLERYGAEAFMYGVDGARAVIQFRASGRLVRFDLPLPKDNDQETRRRWRALVLVVKSKLEAVASGIVTFEEEFLAHIVLPDGSKVAEWMGPQIEEAYASGKMPELLPSARQLTSGGRS
jgi:hypothetical protein